MVNLYIGVDAPKLTKLITNEVNQYHMYKKGQIQREFVSIIVSFWLFVRGRSLLKPYVIMNKDTHIQNNGRGTQKHGRNRILFRNANED